MTLRTPRLHHRTGGRKRRGRFRLLSPSDIFKRHVCVSPFNYEDIPRLANFIGADRVLFGSDYPHSEGLAEPASYANELEGLDDHAVRRIMRENQRELLIP